MIFRSIVASLLFLTVLSCDSQKAIHPFENGLIGAYYGDPDYTNIKESEILNGLNKVWDEETGHGRTWSGRWQGMLIAPATGKIKFTLQSSKAAYLKIGDTKRIEVDTNSAEAWMSVTMQRDNYYGIEVGYIHSGGGEGVLKIMWAIHENEPQDISSQNLFFTSEQARLWNWIPEPDPEQIDYSQYLKAKSEHQIVYSAQGRFCGWPANNGIWTWEDEIVVGFTLAYYQEKEHHHSVDELKPSYSVLSRSIDGGKTWTLEDPKNFIGDGSKSRQLEKKINFAHPDFAMRASGNQYYYSYDRCKTWQGPFLFPDFERQKLTSRTDYIINSADDCYVFLSTEEKSVQARLQDITFCARTTDGGKNFTFLSWIGAQANFRAVMPSTIRTSESHLITAMRRRFDEQFKDRPRLPKNWIDVYESMDNGQTWKFLSKVAETDMGKHNGNPPSLIRLRDKRICVTYGYRAVPYGIRARISDDLGKTWSEVIHLRGDGRTFDIGYTRSVQRPDGKVVTIYYYTTDLNREQHIAATIWDPDVLYY